MKTSETDENTAVLWQHKAILLPNGLIGYLFYYYRTYRNPNKSKTFYRCAYRVCDKSWANDFPHDNPAEISTVEDLGIKDEPNWKLFYYKRHLMRLDLYRHLKRDFDNAIPLSDFILKNKTKTEPFLTEYEGLDISDYRMFEKDRWYVSDRKRKHSGTYGRVIH